MKKILKHVARTVPVTVGMVVAASAHAVSFQDVSGTLGLGTTDLVQTITALIKWALGLLGLVAVIMIIIGGFRWMTAGGNEDKIDSAKKILYSAVIGLVIVLLAWAIVAFTTGTLNNTAGISAILLG